MKATIQELLDRIRSRRKVLLDEYNEYELHQLRVSVRRLRGLLRFEDSPGAWHLRKELGYLISHTNAARDWDTLANAIESLPENEQPVALIDALDSRRAEVWKKVAKSLENSDWDEAMANTERYLEQRVSDIRLPPTQEESFYQAGRRLNRAWKRVLEQDNNLSWHKLRIAVKDLRYSLDAADNSRYEDPIKLCRLLQERLGTWHDSIVHRDLLNELDGELSHNEIAAKRAVQSLKAGLKNDARRCLEEVTDIMNRRGHELRPRES